MGIWEIDKLILFIAFVIPGFISIKAYQLLCPGSERNTSDQLIDAIAYSSINYALLFSPIITIESGSLKNVHPSLYYMFYVFVLFVAPIIWVLVWRYLRTKEFFLRNAPHPTKKPWDYLFSQRKPYWVEVFLKNGNVIAGLYANNSSASSAPAPEQIYLEETWIMDADGKFERAIADTAGVIILTSEISHIEFRKYNVQ
ncbi:DUF6338 family protein [Psychrobacter alimentarius]|uniref:DUF6338 family protein n=1 Tax=Psychrobacter alimentarius TaxID=261164 RepID=UPI00191900A8|nr:DUF6338 family protein [Psychrobacter alimentarius]